MQKALDQFLEAFKYRITFTPEVEVAEVGELPRFELKAKRVIRDKQGQGCRKGNSNFICTLPPDSCTLYTITDGVACDRFF